MSEHYQQKLGIIREIVEHNLDPRLARRYFVLSEELAIRSRFERNSAIAVSPFWWNYAQAFAIGFIKRIDIHNLAVKLRNDVAAEFLADTVGINCDVMEEAVNAMKKPTYQHMRAHSELAVAKLPENVENYLLNELIRIVSQAYIDMVHGKFNGAGLAAQAEHTVEYYERNPLFSSDWIGGFHVILEHVYNRKHPVEERSVSGSVLLHALLRYRDLILELKKKGAIVSGGH